MKDAPAQLRDGELLAAVDLGSNSFHLVVARYEHGGLRLIDRLRDSVRMFHLCIPYLAIAFCGGVRLPLLPSLFSRPT